MVSGGVRACLEKVGRVVAGGGKGGGGLFFLFFFLVEVKGGRVGERGRQIFSLACDSTVKTLLMLMCIRSESGKY